MELLEYENGLYIDKPRDFNLKHIFDCGQCFRWNENEDGSYIGVINSKVIHAFHKNDNVYFEGVSKEDAEYLTYYFDLNRDYGYIKEKISENDNVMKEAIKEGWGIRILNQDPFEIVISFIISARNSIPSIKKTVDNISRKFGEKIRFNGEEYYSFPSPEKLSKASEQELRECGCSFRAPYVYKTTRDILEGNIDLKSLKSMNTDDALNELMKLSGVGMKVGDCIMLFSLEKHDAFPVDVWVQRIMEYFYIDEKTSLKKIRVYARDRFKEYAGFSQQYLFYYARDFKGREGLIKR